MNKKKYIYKSDLDENKNNEGSPPNLESNGPETKNGIIYNSLFVKLRESPNPQSEVMDVLRNGDRVVIIGKEREFYEVLAKDNLHGYIFYKFLREE